MNHQTSIPEDHENQEIIKNIIMTKQELDLLRQNYEFAESDLIDYYLYQLKAHRARLDFLVKTAKQKNLQLNAVEKMKYDEII